MKDKAIKVIVFLYILIYFVLTVFIEKDYGWSADDMPQRDHSLIAYKYINSVLFDRDLSDKGEFGDLPDIDDYDYKYYGVALQLPYVFIEDLNGFNLGWDEVFHIRHMGTALMCAIGYVFFYLFIKGITGRRDLGFLALLMLSLYPRFFGERFINIKDQVFVATCCLAYYGLFLYFKNNRDYKYGILVGLTASIATFSRNVAIMFPIIVIAFIVISDIVNGYIKTWWISFRDILVVGCSYLFFWYLGTPVAWFHNPLQAYVESYVFFRDYKYNSGICVFEGHVIEWAQYPWYYIFTWIGITVPIVYLVLFIIGHVRLFRRKESFKQWLVRMTNDDKYLALAIVMFWGPCILVAVHEIKIYTSWRHLYFVMIPLIMMSIYGFEWIEQHLKKTYSLDGKILWLRNRSVTILWIVMIGFVASQVWWMIKNHPYEYVFFNSIGRPVADRFDRDFFKGCEYDLLRYLISHDNRDRITVGFPDSDASMALIPWEERSNIDPSYAYTDNYDWDCDYTVWCYAYSPGNNYEVDGYDEIYSIEVDGFKIGSLFKRCLK